MSQKDKQLMEKNRKETSIKTLYFNRYLLVRYVNALFLVMNMYWISMLYLESSPVYLMLFPLALIILCGFSMWEMAQMNTREQKATKWTPIFYQVNMVANVLLIILAIVNQYPRLFPSFQSSTNSQLAIIAIQLLGILLSLIVLNRLKQIRFNQDKQYARIQVYLKAAK